MTVTLKLSTRDPIIARDGRPFGADSGTRMKSLGWPLPATVAGAIRTAVGDALGGGFPQPVIDALLRLRITGPFPCCDSLMFFPQPHDALRTRTGNCVALRPELLNSSSGVGTDLPGGLWPSVPDAAVALEKFDDPPVWCSAAKLDHWLSLTSDAPITFFQPPEEFLSQAAADERTHVEIDPLWYSARDGRLFSTTGIVLDRMRQPGEPTAGHSVRGRATELCVRVETIATSPLDQAIAALLTQMDRVQPLGGERRLIRIQTAPAATAASGSCSGLPTPSTNLIAVATQPLTIGSRFRMALLTPAIFRQGWLPGWLNVEPDGSMSGTPPALHGTGCVLRLRSVSIQRWEAVSGWSYESQGPKPVRRMVPAGGVYFFEVADVGSGLASQADVINRMWMKSVSDVPQDQNDGFGIAAWGVWKPR